MVLLLAVFFSLPVCGQTFTLSYTTFADSQYEIPLTAVIEYEITDEENRQVSITGFSGAFSDLTLPASVVYDTLEYQVTEIGEGAFRLSEEEHDEELINEGCLHLPVGVSIIGNYAFENALFNIQMDEGVRIIGEGAFAGCKNFKTDHLPGCLEMIGPDAFRHSGLADTLFVPGSVLEIGGGAFAECGELKGFSLPSDHSLFSVADGILFDAEGGHLIQYPGGKTDPSFIVPSTVTDVEDAAFAGCYYLHTVSFSNDNTSLWKEVFANCKMLENISLPCNLTFLSESLFSGCSQLKAITIPEKVTLIRQQAFLDCTSITNITLPKDVLSIGQRCFWGCDGLQWIKAFPHLPPMMEEEVFSKSDIPVYLHSSSIDLYRQSGQWSTFKAYIPIAEVYAEDQRIYPLGKRSFDLLFETTGLENAVFDAVEFTLSLPGGFSLASDSISDVSWILPEEQPNEGMSVDVNKLQEGTYHFVIKAEEGRSMIVGHYPLLTLNLCADSLIEDVDLSGMIVDAQIKYMGERMEEMSSSFFTIQVDKLLVGDVNFDNRQNVVDVMSIVTHILDNHVEIPLSLADINQDSVIDIVDVMILVQIILNNE